MKKMDTAVSTYISKSNHVCEGFSMGFFFIGIAIAIGIGIETAGCKWRFSFSDPVSSFAWLPPHHRKLFVFE